MPTRFGDPGNHLLSFLPPAERKLVEDLGTEVDLAIKDVLSRPGEPIRQVYFPVTGVTSTISELEGGQLVEIATIGNEGFVGLPVFLGAVEAPHLVFAQVAGKSLRLETGDFHKALKSVPALHNLLHKYTHALFGQIAQSVACNRIHAIAQRCARWLLMTHDRVDDDTFKLTQEFLGQMLGVRRASVNEVARKLMEDGLIRYERGVIEVLDRGGLEEASCGCYRTGRQEYDRLLGG